MSRLGHEVSRILFVKNLPYAISGEELYKLFGKFGPIQQIRIGDDQKKTLGTAFVVFEDVLDAKEALETLRGFKVGERYLVVLYFQTKHQKNDDERARRDREREEEEEEAVAATKMAGRNSKRKQKLAL